MTITVTKTGKKPADKLDHRVNGTPENTTEDGKMKIVKELFKQAKKIDLNYEALKEELYGYKIELPEQPDIVNISELNEKYALAQSALSRVSAIEMVAIDNATRWEQVVNFMGGYIEDRKSRILVREDVVDMKVKQQEATVRLEMQKDYERRDKLLSHARDAESFLDIVKVKKKDLSLIVVNISRQVKVLSLDYEINKPLNR